MPATDLILQHGTLSSSAELSDEPNILVDSLNISAARERKEYKNSSGAVSALRYVNPILTMAFSGTISVMAGLCDQHPGTAVASLAGYQSTTLGFDPADGVMVLEDPSRDLSQAEPGKCSFNVVQFPHIV